MRYIVSHILRASRLAYRNPRVCILWFTGVMAQCAMAQCAMAADSPTLERFEYRTTAMGANLDIVLYAPSVEIAGTAISQALQTLDELSVPINNYAPQSEVTLLQKLASNKTTRISSELAACIEECKRWFELSEGAFDSTQSELFRVWKQARKSQSMPQHDDIQNALRRSHWPEIRISHEHGEATIQHTGSRLSIDIGGLAVGFLIDRMMETLGREGIQSAMIDAGGDILVSNAPPDRPQATKQGWVIEIAGLEKTSPILHRLYLENCSVTTSGDLSQFSMIEGKRFSHIVDPKSAQPISQRRSVTVVAQKGLDADAGATALAAMGPVEAFRLVERMPIEELIYVTLDEANSLPIVQHWKR